MELSGVCGQYEAATQQFLKVVASLSTAQLDVSKGGEWTPRQIIHHVADSEAQSYARLRRLIVEPGTLIQGYDESAWGEDRTLGYSELPIENSIAVFTAVRAASLDILKRLSDEQLSNAGTHSESGSYSIHNWIANYVAHPVDHADQILRQIA
jgi:hypothetical protein